jgi:rare lipoprotein A (peptidoglycan hydrolase)
LADKVASPYAEMAGAATFYAEGFQGQTMANGAAFDMADDAVAAANRWPLGTRLRLRRIPGGPWDARLTPDERDRYFSRSIEVVVQDRGAFDHELDLGLGAFRLLGRPDEGVIRVLIEPVRSGACDARNPTCEPQD